jgi:DTW domain-containing protein YfiP
MARNLCTQCQRPTSACICGFIIKTHNKIPVLVLQHPTEVKQSKGTVALLQRSLINCKVLIGEDFSANSDLDEILASHQALLLYPGEHSQILSLTNQTIESTLTNKNAKKSNNTSAEISEQKPPLLIIIDGTWKKSYRMFMLSKNLHTLIQVCLPDYIANNGQYLIRKVAKKNALSSLEATCYALALLEGELVNVLDNSKHIQAHANINCGLYQPILNKFSQFNQFQLSFRK